MELNLGKLIRMGFGGICIALFLGGCGEGVDTTVTESGTESEASETQLELSEQATVVSPETAADIEVDAGTLRVELPAPPKLRDQRVGRYLIADSEAGFWRQIAGIRKTDRYLVFETEPANLTDVVKQGRVHIEMSHPKGVDRPIIRTTMTGNNGDVETRRGALTGGEESISGPDQNSSFRPFKRRLSTLQNLQVNQKGFDLEVNGKLELYPKFDIFADVTNGKWSEYSFDVSLLSGSVLEPTFIARSFHAFLRLTPPENGKRGGAWYTDRVPVDDGFETTFNFRAQQGADNSPGRVDFMVQNGPDGNQKLESAYALAYDINRGGDGLLIRLENHDSGNQGDRVKLFTQNQVKDVQLSVDLEKDTLHTAKTVYDPGDANAEPTVRVYVDDMQQPQLIERVDLANVVNLEGGSSAYIGFNASTSQRFSQFFDIISWSYRLLRGAEVFSLTSQQFYSATSELEVLGDAELVEGKSAGTDGSITTGPRDAVFCPGRQAPPSIKNSGCADGQREGYKNKKAYSKISSCAGGWSKADRQWNQPACDRSAGDDSDNPGGQGCRAADLCAPGWGICNRKEVEQFSNGNGCADSIPPPIDQGGMKSWAGDIRVVHPVDDIRPNVAESDHKINAFPERMDFEPQNAVRVDGEVTSATDTPVFADNLNSGKLNQTLNSYIFHFDPKGTDNVRSSLGKVTFENEVVGVGIYGDTQRSNHQKVPGCCGDNGLSCPDKPASTSDKCVGYRTGTVYSKTKDASDCECSGQFGDGDYVRLEDDKTVRINFRAGGSSDMVRVFTSPEGVEQVQTKPPYLSYPPYIRRYHNAVRIPLSHYGTLSHYGRLGNVYVPIGGRGRGYLGGFRGPGLGNGNQGGNQQTAPDIEGEVRTVPGKADNYFFMARHPDECKHDDKFLGCGRLDLSEDDKVLGETCEPLEVSSGDQCSHLRATWECGTKSFTGGGDSTGDSANGASFTGPTYAMSTGTALEPGALVESDPSGGTQTGTSGGGTGSSSPTVSKKAGEHGGVLCCRKPSCGWSFHMLDRIFTIYPVMEADYRLSAVGTGTVLSKIKSELSDVKLSTKYDGLRWTAVDNTAEGAPSGEQVHKRGMTVANEDLKVSMNAVYDVGFEMVQGYGGGVLNRTWLHQADYEMTAEVGPPNCSWTSKFTGRGHVKHASNEPLQCSVMGGDPDACLNPNSQTVYNEDFAEESTSFNNLAFRRSESANAQFTFNGSQYQGERCVVQPETCSSDAECSGDGTTCSDQRELDGTTTECACLESRCLLEDAVIGVVEWKLDRGDPKVDLDIRAEDTNGDNLIRQKGARGGWIEKRSPGGTEAGETYSEIAVITEHNPGGTVTFAVEKANRSSQEGPVDFTFKIYDHGTLVESSNGDVNASIGSRSVNYRYELGLN